MKTSDQRSASQGAAKTLRRPARRQSKGMSADRGLERERGKNTLGFLIQIRSGLGVVFTMALDSFESHTDSVFFFIFVS